MDDSAERVMREKFNTMRPLMNERTRRMWAATEARAHGHGGTALASRATGMSRLTVAKGERELEAAGPEGLEATDRWRATGAGRKRLSARDPGLGAALDRRVDPATRGEPDGPLLWTSLSAALLAAELTGQGPPASERSVNRLLHERGYSLQSNRKTSEDRQHWDRQLRHINRRARAFQGRGDPVVSVDTKKKELVGDIANGGRE